MCVYIYVCVCVVGGVGLESRFEAVGCLETFGQCLAFCVFTCVRVSVLSGVRRRGGGLVWLAPGKLYQRLREVRHTACSTRDVEGPGWSG